MTIQIKKKGLKLLKGFIIERLKTKIKIKVYDGDNEYVIFYFRERFIERLTTLKLLKLLKLFKKVLPLYVIEGEDIRGILDSIIHDHDTLRDLCSLNPSAVVYHTLGCDHNGRLVYTAFDVFETLPPTPERPEHPEIIKINRREDSNFMFYDDITETKYKKLIIDSDIRYVLKDFPEYFL